MEGRAAIERHRGSGSAEHCILLVRLAGVGLEDRDWGRGEGGGAGGVGRWLMHVVPKA